MSRLTSALFIALFLFTFSSSALAQQEGDQWTPNQFTGVFNESIDTAIIYKQNIPWTANKATSYKYTNTPCIFSFNCANVNPSAVCRNNPDTGQKVCAIPKEKTTISTEINITETDYNPETTSGSYPLPKLQSITESAFTINNQLSKNPLSQGSLNLLMPKGVMLSIILDAVEAAHDTKVFVGTQDIFPIAGFPYERIIELENGSTVELGDFYNKLPSYVRNRQDGWQKKTLTDDNQYTKALKTINPLPYEIREKAYARARLTVESSSFNIIIRQNTTSYNTFARSDLYAAIMTRNLLTPSSLIQAQNQKLESKYELLKQINNKDLVSPPTEEIYDDYKSYINLLIDNNDSPGLTIPKKIITDNTNKPGAGSVQPANSSDSLFLTIILNLLSKFIDINVETTVWNVVPPSKIIAQDLLIFNNNQILTAKDTKKANYDKKSTPAKTNVQSFELALGEGAAINYLSNKFSTFMSCKSDFYAQQDTEIIDYLHGTRSACAGSIPIVSQCEGDAFEKLISTSALPELSDKGQQAFTSQVLPGLTPEVISVYAEAERQTGVPCEVLAGIHWVEGGNSPDQNLQNGGPISSNLLNSAIEAAKFLKAKVGDSIDNLEELYAALSRYNGGGNSNCASVNSFDCSYTPASDRCGYFTACATDSNSCTCTSSPEPNSCREMCANQGSGAFPFQFSYNYCSPYPPEGYDDPYVTNYLASPEHDTMYLLYQYDCTQTRPFVWQRPGTFTTAIQFYMYNR